MKSVSTSRNVLFGFLGWLLPLGFTVVFTPVIVHGLGVTATVFSASPNSR